MSAEVLGYNIWTKNSPKPYIAKFADFAHDAGLPIAAIVDDVLPEVVFGRDPAKTAEMNDAYQTHMEATGFDKVHFVSDLLPDRSMDFVRLFEMSGRLNVSAFFGLLPKQKTAGMDSLRLNEIVDTCWQIYVLESGIAQAGVTTYLTGKRSTALFRLAKSTIPSFQFQTIA